MPFDPLKPLGDFYATLFGRHNHESKFRRVSLFEREHVSTVANVSVGSRLLSCPEVMLTSFLRPHSITIYDEAQNAQEAFM